ncbi:MAG: hypothetical protein U9O83_04385 [Campylobacterota bacterium]|nr:hypothetical protein [Campylobacterota bacterium]
MKPLLVKELPNFISRFGNFIDAEIRSIDIISPTTAKVIIACQDSARDFDWLTINLEFSYITDARFLEESKLSLLDMSDGASLIFEEGDFAFGIGNYHNLSGMKNAVSYIISSNIKYEEGLF